MITYTCNYFLLPGNKRREKLRESAVIPDLLFLAQSVVVTYDCMYTRTSLGELSRSLAAKVLIFGFAIFKISPLPLLLCCVIQTAWNYKSDHKSWRHAPQMFLSWRSFLRCLELRDRGLALRLNIFNEFWYFICISLRPQSFFENIN